MASEEYGCKALSSSLVVSEKDNLVEEATNDTSSTTPGNNGTSTNSIRLMRNMEGRQRINQDRIQKRQIESQKRMDPMESVEKFWSRFQERAVSISNTLEILKQQQPHRVTAAHRHAARQQLDELQHCLLELQQSSSQSMSLFLPQADVRRANEEIERLFQQLLYARDAICPREKFTFHKYRAWKQHQQQSLPICTHESQKKQEEGVSSNSTILCITMPLHNEDSYGFDNKVSTHLSSDDIPLAGSIAEQSTVAAKTNIHLTNLKHCVVTLKESYGSLKLQDNQNCIFYCSPVSGPIFVERCFNCTLIVASRQLRIHDSANIHCILFVTSGPIIEGSSQIYFSRLYVPTLQARFGSTAPPIDIDVAHRIVVSCGLVALPSSTTSIHDLDPKFLDSQNEFRNVKDFMWHKLLQQSPNWSTLSDEEIQDHLLLLSDERKKCNTQY
jgi:hypothetical protein